MRVLLFGATGLAGSFVLQELLNAAYRVTAVSRRAANIENEHERLEKLSGDVLDASFIQKTLAGHDAVISTISEGIDIVHHTQSKGNENIIRCMEMGSPKRFICMGAAGILDAADGRLVRDHPEYPEMYLPLSYEHSQVHQRLQASSLLWTQVCPPLILPKPSDGNFGTMADELPSGKGQVNAGNIGAFITAEIQKNEFVRKRVGITNRN